MRVRRASDILKSLNSTLSGTDLYSDEISDAIATAIRSLECWNNISDDVSEVNLDIRFENEVMYKDGVHSGAMQVIRLVNNYLSRVENGKYM